MASLEALKNGLDRVIRPVAAFVPAGREISPKPGARGRGGLKADAWDGVRGLHRERRALAPAAHGAPGGVGDGGQHGDDKPTTFFYINPPYWDYEDYYGRGFFNRGLRQAGGAAGGRAGEAYPFPERHAPGVPETFRGFRFEEGEVTYTCSNGKNLKTGK